MNRNSEFRICPTHLAVFAVRLEIILVVCVLPVEAFQDSFYPGFELRDLSRCYTNVKKTLTSACFPCAGDLMSDLLLHSRFLSGSE